MSTTIAPARAAAITALPDTNRYGKRSTAGRVGAWTAGGPSLI